MHRAVILGLSATLEDFLQVGGDIHLGRQCPDTPLPGPLREEQALPMAQDTLHPLILLPSSPPEQIALI